MQTFMDQLARWWCAFRGHDVLLQVGVNRLSLRCASCGHESPGWVFDAPRPVVLPRVLRFRKRLSA